MTARVVGNEVVGLMVGQWLDDAGIGEYLRGRGKKGGYQMTPM